MKYLSEGPQSTTISLWLIIPGQFLNFYNVHYVDYKGHDHAHMKKTPNRQCIKIACLFFNSVYSHTMFVANHFSYFRASVRLYVINYKESVSLWFSIYMYILYNICYQYCWKYSCNILMQFFYCKTWVFSQRNFSHQVCYKLMSLERAWLNFSYTVTLSSHSS